MRCMHAHTNRPAPSHAVRRKIKIPIPTRHPAQAQDD